VLRSLRGRFDPSTFMPRTVGSFILFHPWQDIEGLSRNLEAMRRERVESLFHSLNFNDMRFHPGVPLYHLAERDGLLARVEQGRVQDVPLSGYFSELPWRFEDPDAAGVHALWSTLERHIVERIGLLEACVSSPRTRPDRARAGIEELASLMSSRVLPPSRHRSLAAGSRSNTGHPRPIPGGRAFADDLPSLLASLEDLGSLEQTRLTIWGPEPTMVEALPDLVSAARRQNPHEVELLTNGRMLVYPWYSQKLAAAGLDLATATLHSADSTLHDGAVRVDGAFEQALTGLKVFASQGGATAIAAVVGPENAGALTLFPPLARSLGARELRFIVPVHGLDLSSLDDLRRDLAAALSGARSLGISAGFDHELSFRWLADEP
jgi:hypothetical protein